MAVMFTAPVQIQPIYQSRPLCAAIHGEPKYADAATNIHANHTDAR